MFNQDLEMFRLTRAETLRVSAGITQAQSEFAPAPGKWSVGEVLDHLLLAENFYRRIFVRLVELQKSGARPVIRSSFAEVNTSIAYIPKSLLPLLEVPFTVFNMFVPAVVRAARCAQVLLRRHCGRVSRESSARLSAYAVRASAAGGQQHAASAADRRTA